MNEDQIETALRNAPEPAPPPGLRERLEEQIRVPDRNAEGRSRFAWFLNRRGPLLGWAAVLIAIMVIGVQSHQMGQLRRDNEQLLKTVAVVEDQRAAPLLDDRIQLFQAEIERLRRQNVELHQLRAEVARLRQEAGQIEPLQAEIEQLKGRLGDVLAQLSQRSAEPPPEFSSEAWEDHNQAIACMNNLKQIALGAMIYQQSSGGVFPSDFTAMTNELPTPRVLWCPSDTGRIGIASWNQFNPSIHVTYELLNPGGLSDQATVVFARCPIHEFVTMSDGSVVRPGEGQDSGFLDGVPGTHLPGQRPMYQGEPAQADPSPEYYDRLMMERYGIIPTRPAAPTSDLP